jgi:hypothetical protein
VVSFFKEKSPAAVFWLIVVCFGLHFYSLIDAPDVIIKPGDGFFYYILKPLLHVQPYSISLLYVIYIFLLALQLNFMMNILRMMPKQSYTPALAFLLFTALMPQLNAFTPALFACNLFIWILYGAARLYATQNPKTAIYNFGLLVGLCAVLYFPSLPLVVIAFIALAIIRPFNMAEWFVLLFGILTPAYFLTGYLFFTGQLDLLPPPPSLFNLQPLPLLPKLIIIGLVVAGLAVCQGIFTVHGFGKSVLIQVRKSWSVFLIALILLAPALFFIVGAFPMVLYLLMVPAACYTGFAFANNRTILSAIFFWLLLALDIYNLWLAKY